LLIADCVELVNGTLEWKKVMRSGSISNVFQSRRLNLFAPFATPPEGIPSGFAFFAVNFYREGSEEGAKNTKGIVLRYGTRKKRIGRKRNGLR
jgi:hypothetical protein